MRSRQRSRSSFPGPANYRATVPPLIDPSDPSDEIFGAVVEAQILESTGYPLAVPSARHLFVLVFVLGKF